MTDTQREAQEIIWNVTANYRAGNISLWQWWEVTHRALLDGLLSEVRNETAK